MNILTFTSLYPNNIWPNHGVFVKERTTAIATQRGNNVRVVAPVPYHPTLRIGKRWKYSEVSKAEMRDGLEVYHPRYFLLPKVAMPSHGWSMYRSSLALLRTLDTALPIEVIDAHYVYPDGFAAALLASHLRKPLVITGRGSDVNRFANFRTIRPFLRFALQRADGVIAVCSDLRDAMVRLGAPPGKIQVIPNGVDSRKFYPVEKSEARKSVGLPEKKVILSVAGLTPNKGVDFLIRALHMLSARRRAHDALLVVVGSGDDRKKLEKLASDLNVRDRIVFAGSVPHHELFRWYSAADVCCLASRQEGWPNVILESMACGTPVVATKAGAAPEIIRNGELGLLTERNVARLAADLDQALGTRWNRESIVEYARRHTWEGAAGRVLEVLGSIDRRPALNPSVRLPAEAFDRQ